MTMLGEDDFVLAGEYVLGLLDRPSEVSAAARVATDAAFAAEVEAWRLRLMPMVDGNDTPTPPHIWYTIQASLPVPTQQDNKSGSVRVWQAIAGASSMTAAVLAILLLQPPAPVVTPVPIAPLVAALGSETGTSSMTARYDSANGQMLLTPVSLQTGELYPELWIIPADGNPRSLGMVRADGPSQINVGASLRGFIDEGATLAITSEPIGGGPGGKPSGPVIASGKITTV